MRKTETELDSQGRVVQRQRLLCPNCITFHWLTLPAPVRFRCPTCNTLIPVHLGFSLGEIGFDVSYFGWFYGIVYEAQEEQERRSGKRVRYRLETPVEVLQLLGLWVAAGIVGNLGYDLIKTGAARIYAKFRAMRQPRSELAGQVITASQGLRNLPDLLRHAAEAIEAESGTKKRFLRVLIEAEEEYGTLRKLAGRRVKLQAKSTQTLSSPRKPIRSRNFRPLGATIIRTKQKKATKKRRRP